MADEKDKAKSKFVVNLLNDYVSMGVFFVLALLSLTGDFGRKINSKLVWHENYDSWKELNQIPCYAYKAPYKDLTFENKIIIVDNITDIAPGTFEAKYDGKTYHDFDEWASAQAVNVTAILVKC